DGDWIVIQPVTAFQPRGNQQGHRYRTVVHFLAELGDVVQRALANPGDRDDQLPRHITILTMSGVQMVTYTRTASVSSTRRPANSVAQPRPPRSPQAHR